MGQAASVVFGAVARMFNAIIPSMCGVRQTHPSSKIFAQAGHSAVSVLKALEPGYSAYRSGSDGGNASYMKVAES